MPIPTRVELQPYNPDWAHAAQREALRLEAASNGVITSVHHIGSTAIPGIRAKPILDLIPVVRDLAAWDSLRPQIEALGYAWWGEFGLPGRRYCTWDNGGAHKIHLHCYEAGTSEITRRLAFRDHLRRHSTLAQQYEMEKSRCGDLHPLDSQAYSACKSEWIKRIEAEALA